MGCTFLLIACFIFFKCVEADHDNTLETQVRCEKDPCSYTEGQTVWFHAYSDGPESFGTGSLAFDQSTGLFYTREGCLADEGLLFGDPALCDKKATSNKDFSQVQLEHDGQWEPRILKFFGEKVSYDYRADLGELDYIPIDTIDDCDVEGDEVFSVYSRSQLIDQVLGSSDPDDGFEVVIEDNDDEYYFATDHYVVAEEPDASTTVTLTVNRNVDGVLAERTIEYSTMSLTAESPNDFTQANKENIDFADGDTTATVDITINSDDQIEGPEVFAVKLFYDVDVDPTVCTGKIGEDGITYITIHDPETTLFSFEYHDYTVCEPLQGETETIALNVVRSGNTAKTSTIGLSIRDISARGGLDYTLPSLTVNFDVDDTMIPVSIDIESDASKEEPETFELSIDAVPDNNDVISKPCTTVVTIYDSSTKRSCVEFTAPAVSVLESSSAVSVTLLRSGNVEDAAEIGLTTADVDAKSDQDYTGLQSSTILFGPGQTIFTATIPIMNDQIKESDECFKLSLHKLTGAVDNVDICSTDATVIIKDDDDQFYFEGTMAKVEEGECTEVTILRCGYLDKESSVNVNVLPSSADNSDYEEIEDISPFIQFGNNQDSHTLRICAIDDSLYEKDEKFSLVLQPNAGQIRFPDQVWVVIKSNDDQFYFGGIFARVEEGQCTEVNILRSGYLDQASSVLVTSVPSSADTRDYAIQGISSAIQFGKDRVSHTLQICATDDTLYEKDEIFSLVLQPDTAISNNGHIGFPDQVTVLIVSNDVQTEEPISCDPVCVNGECVEGNNCDCDRDYAGERCEFQITCSLELPNGNVEPLQDAYDVGSEITCSCETGYRLAAGISTLTCILVPPYVAKWSPRTPICIEEEGRPPIISCEPDCGDNGECAEGNNCVCETEYTGYRCQTQITCSSLPLTNDNVVHVPLQNNYDVGSQVTFSCEAGYRLVGMSTLTCIHSPPNVFATWSPLPPICIEEEDNTLGLIGTILAGVAVLGVLMALSLGAYLCFRNVINPPTNPLQQQPQVQLMPYDGVNQYPFTGNAQTVADPLMF
ncbi:adhesion G-protein coupled receptor V1-like isoform X2 [Amphiura filiformis]|uniref:adhesion G-protein coupled receptor V1-like isoform X2 n=1 Tax=Amphiura filiformis TaxID=82378 RepID=UPI003B216B64